MDDFPLPESSSRWRKLGVVVVVVALLTILGSLIYRFANAPGSAPKRTVSDVVQLKLIQPPPPPPPPPPQPKPKMEEQPKDRSPEMKSERIPDRPPAETPSPAPPGPPALDAAGQGPADAFGLQGKPGGGDFLGGGGGGGGSKYGWYAALIEGRAQQALQRSRGLAHAHFRIGVLVWLNADGSVSRSELVDSTGDRDVDQAIREALRGMPKLAQPPPQDMPQPVVLKISSS